MSELSERSGTTVPTIKFYLREGLLPAAEHTSPNQASYGQGHVDRLRLVRALLDVGGLTISAVGAVLSAVDDTEMPLDWAFGVAQRAIPNRMAADPAPEQQTRGATEVDRLMRTNGWAVTSDNPGLGMSARVLDAYLQLGHEELFAVLPSYASAALMVAETDLTTVAMQRERADMAEIVVVGTVLGDGLFAGLRRMAQEHVSHQRYGRAEAEATAQMTAEAGAAAATSAESTSTQSASNQSHCPHDSPERH